MKVLTSVPRIILFAAIVVALASLGWWLLNPSGNNMHNEGTAHYAGPFKMYVNVNPERPKVGNNSLIVTLLDKDNKPVTDAQIKAVAEMPAMGSMPVMQAPSTMVHTNAGTYEGIFELSMNGAWPLTLEISSASTGNARLEFDLTTSRSGIRLTFATPSKLSAMISDTPSDSGSNVTETGGNISHYTCSMHPSVKSAIPGTCPICSMDLVPITKKELQSGSITLDARRRQLIGVTTGFAQEKHLTQTIRAAGRVTYDETRLMDVTLKFNGWIGKLQADFVGAPVIKGQSLFSVYSPELLSAQQEYLETLRRRKNKNDSFLKAARQRLKLWDITASQIRQLEKRGTPLEYVPIMSPSNGIVIEKMIVEGSAVKTGQRLLRIADLSTVWVEGDIYEYEIPLVRVGMNAKVLLPEQSGKTLYGKVAYITPYLEGDTRTAKVRVELDNSDGSLKPDMYAHVHLNINLGKRLVVPESAVLYAGESRVVFIDLGNGQLQPRKIKTGLRNADDIEVLDGLSPGDKVVTSGNFLIAAETKLKTGINQW